MKNKITNIMNTFSPLFHKMNDKKRLVKYLNLIDDILNSNYSDAQKFNGILHVQKQLANMIQVKINDLIIQEEYKEFPEPKYSVGDSLTSFWTTDYFYPKSVETYSLNVYPLISIPWHKKRFLDCWIKIGLMIDKPFIENNNHYATLYFPINVIEFHNGLHSGTIAIAEGNSKIQIQKVIDISNIYDHNYFDGKHFINKYSKRKLCTPDFPEIGILFEIGRKLLNSNFLINP